MTSSLSNINNRTLEVDKSHASSFELIAARNRTIQHVDNFDERDRLVANTSYAADQQKSSMLIVDKEAESLQVGYFKDYGANVSRVPAPQPLDRIEAFDVRHNFGYLEQKSHSGGPTMNYKPIDKTPTTLNVYKIETRPFKDIGMHLDSMTPTTSQTPNMYGASNNQLTK